MTQGYGPPSPQEFLKLNEEYGINVAMTWALLHSNKRKTYFQGLHDAKREIMSPAPPEVIHMGKTARKLALKLKRGGE